MPVETFPFDPAAYIDSDETALAYMNDALETGDPAFIADALSVIARARGMVISEETVEPEQNQGGSSSAVGHIEFATVLRMARALGMRFSAEPVR